MVEFDGFIPRPKQKEVLDFEKGKMGVSAVPGSGKTKTLSALAAKLVANTDLQDDQEVLIVTLVNSAVQNFSHQVAQFVKSRELLPNFGYRVRTLHGLANDIVRQRPALVGLDESFQIVDERESNDILNDAVIGWVRANPYFLEKYIDPDLDENRVNRLREQWQKEVAVVAGAFIKQAKDWQMMPEDVGRQLERFSQPLHLAQMCHTIYINYQRGLSYRGAVDFQDLIRLALKALQDDKDYLERLRNKWVYILEDESQDSSKLQEEILALIAGKRSGNWVRVGDPNQSIYETFTTASPDHLRDFIAKRNVKGRELPNSGRSTKSIIKLANYLIDWSRKDHPIEAVRARALHPPHIEPTPKGDPQPNPKDMPNNIHLRPEDYTPSEEIDAIVKSIEHWLPNNTDKTVAVLVPRNDRGSQVVRALKDRNIEVIELLRSTSSTRETAGALALLLDALSNPNASRQMAQAFKVWRRDDRDDPELAKRLDEIVKTLRKCKNVEEYIYPRADKDWLDSGDVAELTNADDTIYPQLIAFRELMQRWQEAVILPIDQLILTLAQDLFDTSADLAIAHSLALYLEHQADVSPHWRLPEFTAELKLVAQNKRRVVDLSEEGMNYNPDDHKGKVTVATMHSAKGLEWDRVYLMAVNNYSFPSAEPQDNYIGEKWYIRDNLNLQAEALAQLDILRRIADNELIFDYVEGDASEESRVEYAAERLRLLYVGITRARQELVMTWNTGRDGKVLQATPFIALQHFWDKQKK